MGDVKVSGSGTDPIIRSEVQAMMHGAPEVENRLWRLGNQARD